MTTESLPVLRVHNLSVQRSGRCVLSNLSLSVREGELLSVVGPNGAGKTTLIRAIAGLQAYDGEVMLRHKSLLSWHPRERAKMLAYVPQRSRLEASLSVRSVVEHGRFSHLEPLRSLRSIDRAVVDLAIERMDVSHVLERRFNQLSGGERRRVLLARALATGARLILLDEPAASLDIAHRLALYARLRELAQDGYTLIVVMHHLDTARRTSDRCAILHQGTLVTCGPSREVIAQPTVSNVFGVTLVEGGALGFALPEKS